MVKEFINSLTLNAALLLLITVFFNTLYIRYWKEKSILSILLGFLIGLTGIALIYYTSSLSPGILFDTRTVLVSMSGMFFGFIPTIIGTVIICAFRLYLGGPGVWMGILSTLFAAAAGILWKNSGGTRYLTKRIIGWNSICLVL